MNSIANITRSSVAKLLPGSLITCHDVPINDEVARWQVRPRDAVACELRRLTRKNLLKVYSRVTVISKVKRAVQYQKVGAT